MTVIRGRKARRKIRQEGNCAADIGSGGVNKASILCSKRSPVPKAAQQVSEVMELLLTTNNKDSASIRGSTWDAA
jgi:hypothetical protein